MARRHHLVEPYDLLGRARLDEVDGLPVWADVARGAGSWSVQTAPAVNGTSFIETGTAQNAPRWHYIPSAARRMLVIEPTRQNDTLYGLILDSGGNEDPDGWANADGAVGVDYDTPNTGSPTGGAYWRGALINAGAAVSQSSTFSVATYAHSMWVRSPGTIGAAKTIAAMQTDTGVYSYLDLPSGTYDWTRLHRQQTVAANVALNNYLQTLANNGGQAWVACVQTEVGLYPTTFIPTAAAAVVRAAELVTLNEDVVGQTAGLVRFLWSPGFASTVALAGNATLFTWGVGWRLDYDPADDMLKVFVNNVAQATSGALTFAAGDLLRLSVRYGSWGQRLSVDGGGLATSYLDTTDWGSPTIAPYLGSRAASANCEAAAYGDLVLAA